METDATRIDGAGPAGHRSDPDDGRVVGISNAAGLDRHDGEVTFPAVSGVLIRRISLVEPMTGRILRSLSGSPHKLFRSLCHGRRSRRPTTEPHLTQREDHAWGAPYASRS